MSLTGKVAIVTGAVRGMGRAIARRLCEDGASVFAVGRTGEEAPDVVDLLSTLGECTAFYCDLATPDQAEQVTRECLKRYGRVDIVCNNAATVGDRRPIHEQGAQSWHHILQVNLISPFLICKAAIADMLSRGVAGRIVNIASIQASMPLPHYAPYAASKGGLISFTKSLAIEYASRGIISNAIDVGCVLSEGMEEALKSAHADPRVDETGARTGAATLNGRFGLPAEIASLVRFLVSEENSHVVGAVIRADGGRSISRQRDPY
ncbi:MAG: SDR family oxidoreductase [Luteitalea sp.]|nr:SDR family oxidoreductase [Luteitalea sp.]